MTKDNDDLFCFFSGFAHQDVEVCEYQENSELGIVFLTCHNHGKHSLSQDDYIQLDGVLCQICEINGPLFYACSTLELVNPTSIKNISIGSKLTLGIMAVKDAEHERMWMLQPSVVCQATYKKATVLNGHEHTLKLDFEAPKKLETVIHQDSHIGISGSSMTAREVSTEGNLIKFSIYCGRETRENTRLNESLKYGCKLNISESAGIANRK